MRMLWLLQCVIGNGLMYVSVYIFVYVCFTSIVYATAFYAVVALLLLDFLYTGFCIYTHICFSYFTYYIILGFLCLAFSPDIPMSDVSLFFYFFYVVIQGLHMILTCAVAAAFPYLFLYVFFFMPHCCHYRMWLCT